MISIREQRDKEEKRRVERKEKRSNRHDIMKRQMHLISERTLSCRDYVWMVQYVDGLLNPDT